MSTLRCSMGAVARWLLINPFGFWRCAFVRWQTCEHRTKLHMSERRPSHTKCWQTRLKVLKNPKCPLDGWSCDSSTINLRRWSKIQVTFLFPRWCVSKAVSFSSVVATRSLNKGSSLSLGGSFPTFSTIRGLLSKGSCSCASSLGSFKSCHRQSCN